MDYTISQMCDTTFPMESINRKTNGLTDLNVNSIGDLNFHVAYSQSGIICDSGLRDNNDFGSQVSSYFVEFLKSNLSTFSLLHSVNMEWNV